MAFKIPPPYDPTRIYAIPQYMSDEGLTSRARVTKWQPRGSYDNPDAFDPSWDKSYAVPSYILGEGYGQGAKVTEWLPRGYYDGDVVRKAKQIKVAQRAMGDVVLPEPFAAYGRKAAAAMITRLRSVPPDMRKTTLRKIMTALDPQLFDRAARYASDHERRGVPSSTALELGIARAMSEGFGREVVDLGKKKQRPAPRGQVGLACYGCAAVLGDTRTTAGLATLTRTPIATAAVAMAPGTCSADGRSIWATAADGSGYWRTRRADEQCAGVSSQTIDVRAGDGGVSGTVKTEKVQMIDVGPFKLPLNQYQLVWGNRPMPDEWQAAITKVMSIDSTELGEGGAMVDAVPGRPYGRLLDFLPNLPKKINRYFVGMTDNGLPQFGRTVIDKGWHPKYPIIMVKRPDTAEDWGLYMYVNPADMTKPWDSTTNPYIVKLQWDKWSPPGPDSLWGVISAIIGRITATIVDVVEEVLEVVGGAACELLSDPNAQAAGGAVAAAYGVPPQAGQQGVASAQGQCGQPPPQETTAAPMNLLPLALAAGGLLGVYLLTRKKEA